MDFSLFAFGDTGWGDELATGFLVTLAMAFTSYAVGTALGLGRFRGCGSRTDAAVAGRVAKEVLPAPPALHGLGPAMVWFLWCVCRCLTKCEAM